MGTQSRIRGGGLKGRVVGNNQTKGRTPHQYNGEVLGNGARGHWCFRGGNSEQVCRPNLTIAGRNWKKKKTDNSGRESFEKKRGGNTFLFSGGFGSERGKRKKCC